ncbi:MAG: cyclase family protein, partial [Anaerolineae bacterium]
EPAAMDWLLARRPSILGFDITSTDSTEAPVGMNKALFASGCLLLAPLVNLRQITKQYVDLIVLPIPVRGVCGAPCRAIAIED